MNEITDIYQAAVHGKCIPEQFSGFKIVSSQMVDLWTPGANFGLMLENRVLFEAEIAPVLIARTFNIPSQSSETIDLLIQMHEFPLTSVEALMFVALGSLAYGRSTERIEIIEAKWARIPIDAKMERGFQLLSPLLANAEGGLKTHLNEMYNEFSVVARNRERIHRDFLEMLGEVGQGEFLSAAISPNPHVSRRPADFFVGPISR